MFSFFKSKLFYEKNNKKSEFSIYIILYLFHCHNAKFFCLSSLKL